MLAAETREELQAEVQLWGDRLQRYGLRLNIEKTEYMECVPRIEDGPICVDGNDLKKVDCFKYLGSRIASTGDILPDALGRANATWMNWRTTTGILCDKKMPIRLKSKVYRTVVRPKTRWLDCVKSDMAGVQLTTRDADNRNKWRRRCSTADPATTWDKR
ncbi:hypothetical protein Y032_0032g2617 [Ancylostoma ceylanicum]|uniref:Reverse transcriptase domain-containing protein n=1 Tax=Ancylostoma ceylanicum TaxID=53326 RepID=A0A016UQ90_9BILA|nr:hypothetical protein Y032_0032g2617 [Ancylostoma ceylanicum]